MEIYAPAAGTVIDAANDLPKNSYEEGRVIEPSIPDGVDPIGLGNHVTIDHGDGEFSILLHMKPGSVAVKRGDRVSQGERIGSIGFSGDTFLPHLHYMVMDGADERTSRGLPSYFSGFKRLLVRSSRASDKDRSIRETSLSTCHRPFRAILASSLASATRP